MAAGLCLLAWAWAVPGLAVEPDEVLDDPALEERARGLSANLRCLVCQNQSIDDSNAELARDLRVLVRERLVAGDSDEEVTRSATKTDTPVIETPQSVSVVSRED
ncbi:MAG: cytochrome c-type biogenesis protein CcmH, partial [Nitratireductor sp.]